MFTRSLVMLGRQVPTGLARQSPAYTRQMWPASSASQLKNRYYSDEQKTKEENENADEPENVEEVQEDIEDQSEEGKLKGELEKCLAESKEWKERFVRLMAEQQNYKKIAQRDITNAREYAVEGFAKQLLEVSDNLKRGVAAATTGEEISKERFDSLVEGVKMTQSLLAKVMKSQGIEEFDPVGEEFDPNWHTALFQQPTEKEDDYNKVINVVSTGFRYKTRVLRAATVGVAVKQE